MKIIAFLLSMVVPLLVSCATGSNADTPLPTVSYSVIASGYHTISGQPVNRKLEVYTDQAEFNASLYLFLQPVTEYPVDFSSRRVALLSLGGRPTGGYAIYAEEIERIMASLLKRRLS